MTRSRASGRGSAACPGYRQSPPAARGSRTSVPSPRRPSGCEHRPRAAAGGRGRCPRCAVGPTNAGPRAPSGPPRCAWGGTRPVSLAWSRDGAACHGSTPALLPPSSPTRSGHSRPPAKVRPRTCLATETAACDRPEQSRTGGRYRHRPVAQAKRRSASCLQCRRQMRPAAIRRSKGGRDGTRPRCAPLRTDE